MLETVTYAQYTTVKDALIRRYGNEFKVIPDSDHRSLLCVIGGCCIVATYYAFVCKIDYEVIEKLSRSMSAMNDESHAGTNIP